MAAAAKLRVALCGSRLLSQEAATQRLGLTGLIQQLTQRLAWSTSHQESPSLPAGQRVLCVCTVAACQQPMKSAALLGNCALGKKPITNSQRVPVRYNFDLKGCRSRDAAERFHVLLFLI